MTFCPRLGNYIDSEIERQETSHIFIASENFASEDVMYACGSEFTNKYAEGYPYRRYYNGCEHCDSLESYGIDLVTALYGAEFANIQPHSGANANLAVFKAFLQPGDTILGMDLSAGGHLSHGASVNISGNWFDSQFYGVNRMGYLDYKDLREKAHIHKPKMIIAGASAYSRQIDWKKIHDIAKEVGAYFLADMSHYSGLIAAGVYYSPVPWADVVTSTTHKTLRGARGGMILWNNPEYTKRINSGVFPGTQGGPLMNQIAGKVQSFYEASQSEFEQYAKDVVDMAKYMCEVFKENNVKVITGGTDSHIILIKTDKKSGQQVADDLETFHNIIVNKNSIPNDPRGVWETSGIRIGTAAMVTKKGADMDYFENIAKTICSVIHDES